MKDLIKTNIIGKPFSLFRDMKKEGKVVISEFGKICMLLICVCIIGLGFTLVI